MKAPRLAISILVLLTTILICVWLAGIVPVDHLGFAVSINFLFMLAFTLIFDTVLKPDYSSGYFEPKPFERGGTIYRWFGVKYYVSILRLIGWEKSLRKNAPIENNLESLMRFDATTRGSEMIHLLSAVFVAALTVWIAAKHSIRDIHWLVLVNVLVNGYPVMLQRYNRPRVRRLVALHEMRKCVAQPSSDQER
jgi:hypothetical protein